MEQTIVVLMYITFVVGGIWLFFGILFGIFSLVDVHWDLMPDKGKFKKILRFFYDVSKLKMGKKKPRDSYLRISGTVDGIDMFSCRSAVLLLFSTPFLLMWGIFLGATHVVGWVIMGYIIGSIFILISAKKLFNILLSQLGKLHQLDQRATKLVNQLKEEE